MSKIYNFLSLVTGDLVLTNPKGASYNKVNCHELMRHVSFLEIYIDHMRIGHLNKNINVIQNELFLVRYGITYAVNYGIDYIVVDINSNILVDLYDIIMVDYPNIKILYMFPDGNVYYTDYPSDKIVHLGGIYE